MSFQRSRATSCRSSTRPAIVVTNKAVEELYTPEERDILQTDYMWHAWDNSQMHRIAPQHRRDAAIWQEELAAAQ